MIELGREWAAAIGTLGAVAALVWIGFVIGMIFGLGVRQLWQWRRRRRRRGFTESFDGPAAKTLDYAGAEAWPGDPANSIDITFDPKADSAPWVKMPVDDYRRLKHHAGETCTIGGKRMIQISAQEYHRLQDKADEALQRYRGQTGGPGA